MYSCVKLKDEPVTSVLKKHEDHIMNPRPESVSDFLWRLIYTGGTELLRSCPT